MFAIRTLINPLFSVLLASLLAILIGLWSIHPPLFHFLTETMAITLAFSILMVTFYSFNFSEDWFPFVMGITYLSVGLFHLGYLLSFNNFNFIINTNLLSFKFLTAGRVLESIGVFSALLLLREKKKLPFVSIFIILLSILFVALIVLNIFPDYYSFTYSKTSFSLFITSIVLLLKTLSLLFLIKNKFNNSPFVNLIIFSLLFSISCDLLFALNDIHSLSSHIAFIISLILMFKAFFEFNIKQPYLFILKNLKTKEAELVKVNNELEKKVAVNIMKLRQKDRELNSEIAQRRSQRNALRSNEEQFRVVIKNLKIMVSHCDRDLHYTLIHDPYGIYNYKHTSGNTGYEITPGEGSKLIIDLKKNVIKQGTVIKKEIVLNLPEGEKVFETTAEPLYDENGDITGVTAIGVDITEKKRIEETLKMKQSVLESIYSIISSSGCAHVDIYNLIVSSIAKLFNVPFVSIVKILNNEKITTIANVSDIACKCQEIHKNLCYQSATIFKTNKPFVYNSDSGTAKIKCSCFKNDLVHSYLGAPIISNNGNCIGIICIMDLKPHSFTKEQIQFVQIFSRYLTNEFERESIQKELIQSQEMKILGILVSGVAHEVRNPLNAIWAITEALFQEIKSDSELTIYKQHIKKQVERLTLLMQELLDFGKPFSCKEDSLISLPSLCQQTIDLWKQSDTVKHSVIFINSSPDDKGIIRGDNNKIQQVLVNLIDNASQHSSIDSTITIHFYRKSSIYHLDIVDQGSGISRDVQDRIFDPFFTTRPKGTGLGLPIVRHIIKVHHGSIELFNNDPPPGATAAITFPAAVIDSDLKQKERISTESITA